MTRVITALILIPLVLIAVFRAPFWLLALFTAFIALTATAEYLDLVAQYRVAPMRRLTLFLTGLFFFFVIVGSMVTAPYFEPVLRAGSRALFVGATLRAVGFLFTFVAFIFLTAGLRLQSLAEFLPSVAMSALALAYIAMPLERLLRVRNMHNGAPLVMYGLLVVWAGDIFALYAGRAVGKHRLAPIISPKKTWEGAIASFVGSAALGCFLLLKGGVIASLWTQLRLLDPSGGAMIAGATPATPWVNALIASASINLAAQLGDLAESAMKRGANVKDSGSLLPGHGGILDRIDALLFAAPVLWYYAAFQFIQY